MLKCIAIMGLLIIGAYLIVQGVGCKKAIQEGKHRLEEYGAKNIELCYGNMRYVDRGDGDVILSVHGIFGGYDQAYDTCKDFASDYRILAPSRFGYPGSDIKGAGTPSEQAEAYVELLDRLGINQVYVLSTSAGGSVAIRFALDYPERTKGLILYCSAMPLTEKPEKYSEYAGPPEFLCNNYAMFLMRPVFGPVMGMDPSTIYSMMPVSERKAGVVLDAAVTNPDMARNYESYDIENLKVPVLILHAKDDKLASYESAVNASARFPKYIFVSFEDGGHLMAGHEAEVHKAVTDFVQQNGLTERK
ncbi:MAG: alpha/beta hydrolase [Frisingicoccus sp.]|uniref:alpha/beta fold hydrolase n=1 Tax=Frisingicoccus sp. TaxID=1918627 RepID=UPI002A8004C3|nr:alpha/beta hydrolase [Frisingicoccus sp.]MDY4833924.1 alpha/beta hydrolase [Frisingicoccus sp.]